MKICIECSEEKRLDEFRKRGPYYSRTCKSCVAEARRLGAGTVERRRPKGFLESRITGDYPSLGETGIYVLYDALGEVFYVGQTTDPKKRVSEHIQKFTDEDITLAIVKNVLIEESVYWEARTLVEYTDAGYTLVNTQTPKTGKKRKGWREDINA